MNQIKKLNIAVIRTDGGTQIRASTNDAAIDEYSEAVKGGAEFPPVTVFYDGIDFWLADGFHRYWSYKRANKASIPAEIMQGEKRDAWLYSLGANDKNGLRRTNDDKRSAVKAALSDGELSKWSDNQIAKQCNVSNHLVSEIRRSILENSKIADAPTVRKVERNGKVYEQETANIGKSHQSANPASKPEVTDPQLPEEGAPDDAEIESVRIQEEAAEKTMQFLLASDEPLADLAAKNTQLEAQIKQLNLRIAGLQNSNTEYIRTIKRLQKQMQKMEVKS